MALRHLQREGYKIITLNWSCPYGEIDIVAQRQNIIVFVEVRARHSHSTEAAFASIDARKRQKIEATARSYLHDHHLEDQPWRIDVIAIATPRDGNPLLQHVEDAFDW